MLTFAALLLAQAPTRLPETVVIETRQAKPLAEASPSVSRLDVAAATDAGQTTLTSLLGGAPGVFATEQSGEGSVGSLFLRGTNSTQTAVLLDGRRLPQGFSNSYEIGRYRIFGLASVEVLRGPSSTLYGANALGGVIDLRQQSPLTARAGSALVAEGGSFGRGTLNYALLANNAEAGKAATQGTALSLTATHDDGFRPNADREAVSAFLKHEQRLSPNLVFDVVGSADHGKAGLPGCRQKDQCELACAFRTKTPKLPSSGRARVPRSRASPSRSPIATCSTATNSPRSSTDASVRTSASDSA